MHNGLRDTYDDNKMVLALSQRFFENKIGVGQLISKIAIEVQTNLDKAIL